MVPDRAVVPSRMGLVVMVGAAVVDTAWPPVAETQPYTGNDWQTGATVVSFTIL